MKWLEPVCLDFKFPGNYVTYNVSSVDDDDDDYDYDYDNDDDDDDNLNYSLLYETHWRYLVQKPMLPGNN